MADPAGECCPPLLDASLSQARAADLSVLFKALADPVRLRLLSLIASAAAGEACACELTDPAARSQATVSHHLAVLTAAGLVLRHQRGKWAWYRVAPERHEFVRSMLSQSQAALDGHADAA